MLMALLLFLLKGAVQDAVSCAVVSAHQDASCRLLVSEFDAGGAEGDKFLSAVTQSCNFSFSCRACCHFERSGDDHDWGVDRLCVDAMVAKADVATSTAASCGCNKAVCVANAFKHHVACTTCDVQVWVSGGAVEETFNGLGSGHCASSDLGTEVVECVHHNWVDGTCAAQEMDAKFLEAFDFLASKGR